MTKIAGVILRALGRQDTADFYAALGLQTDKHAHGGPIHHEVTPFSPEMVLEIYQSSPTFQKDAVMVEVDSLEETITILERLGVKIEYSIVEGDTFRFLYTKDPDNRDVMLLQYIAKKTS